MRRPLFLLLFAFMLSACQTTGTGPQTGRGSVTLSWDTQGILHNYLAASAPELFVLSPDRQKHLVLTCKKGNGQCDPTQMKKGVEAYCKEKFGGTECRIFAEGKTVVWKGALSFDTIDSVRPDQWCDRHQQDDVVCLYFAEADHKTCQESELGTPQYQCEKGDLNCDTPMPELLPAAAYEICRDSLWEKHVITSIKENKLDYGLCKKGILSETALVSECAKSKGEITGYMVPFEAEIMVTFDRLKGERSALDGITHNFTVPGYLSADTDKRRGRVFLYGRPMNELKQRSNPVLCSGSAVGGELWIKNCPLIGWGTFGNFLFMRTDNLYADTPMRIRPGYSNALFEARPNDILSISHSHIELWYAQDRYDETTAKALPKIDHPLWWMK